MRPIACMTSCPIRAAPRAAVRAPPDVSTRSTPWRMSVSSAWERSTQASKARWNVNASGRAAAISSVVRFSSTLRLLVSTPDTMPRAPAALASRICSSMVLCSAPEYTKSPARGRTNTNTGMVTAARHSRSRGRVGVRPSCARSAHSSSRPAPPTTAARAASTDSTAASISIGRPQARAGGGGLTKVNAVISYNHVMVTKSPSLVRRERERSETRRLILEAARRMFVEHGFDATTMRSIASKIGYTATAVYHHFRDKDALVAELCAIDFRALTDELRKGATIADPLERLARMGEAY